MIGGSEDPGVGRVTHEPACVVDHDDNTTHFTLPSAPSTMLASARRLPRAITSQQRVCLSLLASNGSWETAAEFLMLTIIHSVVWPTSSPFLTANLLYHTALLDEVRQLDKLLLSSVVQASSDATLSPSLVSCCNSPESSFLCSGHAFFLIVWLAVSVIFVNSQVWHSNYRPLSR